MYPITEADKELYNHPYRQTVEITFNGTEETLTFTEADVMSGGLSVDRRTVSGTTLELGAVVSSELLLSLDNRDGRYDDVIFEGAELYVVMGTKNWDTEDAPFSYIPMGYFTVDNAPRKLTSISLTALDRMVHFDKVVNWDEIAFPITIGDLLNQICNVCNIVLTTDVDTLTNSTYLVGSAPNGSNEYTYRQLLAWICEITATNGYINWNGELQLTWYPSDNPATTLELSDRFNSDIDDKSITITGVAISDGDNTITAGATDYMINIYGNELIQDNPNNVAEEIFNAIGGLTYTPFTATVQSSPWLYPMDGVSFVDKNGDTHYSVLTGVTFTMNGATRIEGIGESTTDRGYAAQNPLTAKERAIIQVIKKQTNETLETQIQSVLHFNELISNALGLYVSPIVQGDGSTIYYIHDEPSLEESQVIFTMTSGGIAWTNTGWNDGNPVWAYGATSAGEALFKFLSAEGIEVAKAGSDYSIQVTPDTFQIYYKSMPVTTIQADTMTIPKLVATTFAEFGRIRFVPYYEDSELIGTNIVFVN